MKLSSEVAAATAHTENQPAYSADNGHEDLSQNSSRLYHIYHNHWHRAYNITTPTEQQLYYVDSSLFTANKPDLTVHMGINNKAPVIATCKFMHFSRDFYVGLGDPQSPSQVDWEDVSCQGFRRNSYRWQMNLPSGRHTFIWKRTHSVGVEDVPLSSISYRNFKLVDELTGQILAVFTNDYLNTKKAGDFQVYADYGGAFNLISLVTVLALYEKGSRRHRRIAAAGGGAGG